MAMQMNLPPTRSAAEAAVVDTLDTTPGHDPLTGFGDHEKLIADLTTALEPGTDAAVLAVFELVGWRDYRRVLGEHASDELLARCATRFGRVIEPAGACYRSRQDELCALLTGPIEDVSTALFAAEDELNAEASASLVTACFGAAVLPDEAADPIELLILADQRNRLRIGAPKPRERRQDTPPAA
jgi:GGDEF domain-containing protein